MICFDLPDTEVLKLFNESKKIKLNGDTKNNQACVVLVQDVIDQSYLATKCSITSVSISKRLLLKATSLQRQANETSHLAKTSNPGSTMNRAFSPRQRVALFLKSRGHCAWCGCGLNPTKWHADHVVPFALGGPTELWNGQALCIPCNLSKSMNIELKSILPTGLVLRPWQEQVLSTDSEDADGQPLGLIRQAIRQANTL